MHMHVIGNGAAVLGRDDETFFQCPFGPEDAIQSIERLFHCHYASLLTFVTLCCEQLVPHAVPLDSLGAPAEH